MGFINFSIKKPVMPLAGP